MKVFKVTRKDSGEMFCIYRDGATLVDSEFSDAETGDLIEVTLIEMTEEELDALPEFDGW